ncbi:hypothetical protein K402DRAFT_230229 [Aulographum hederae CBS 113979]|uniref:BZIP domain-containing protein n=1 Tax=Aulographum hederae CBS 113979 TaxID=1176131 RepID=A0A6G1HBQ5_9PEZI|nr:hypothetical protein K402DRAFT_230229 [Aulographum hederae CBS 113979]
MSQQRGTAAPFTSSSQGDDPRSRPAPASGHGPVPPHQASREGPGDAGMERRLEQRATLPPLRQHSDLNIGQPEPRIPRSSGVHAILNPPHADEIRPQSQRRSFAQMNSPSVESTSTVASSAEARSFNSGLETGSVSPAGMHGRPAVPRRILTPRSPHQGRNRNVSGINPPSGTINAAQTPFLSPGTGERTHHTAQPGSAGVPPLPITSSLPRPSHQYPHAGTPLAHRRSSQSLAQSGSASPATSYSSYSATGQTSPGNPYHSLVGTPQHHSSVLAPMGAPQGSTLHQASDTERLYGIPVGSTGQASYQMLTIQTGEGSRTLPVEVQAASKVADEKRKRNAGASARFRQRRKEKEKEAGNKIQILERQLQDAQEDRDFYMHERDYFAGVVYNAPGGDRHFPRAQSPRHHRATRAPSSSGAPSVSSAAYSEYSETVETGDMERNTRRRTTYSLPPPQPAVPGQPAYTNSPFPPLVPVPQQGQQQSRQPGAPMPPQQPQQGGQARPPQSPYVEGYERSQGPWHPGPIGRGRQP